MEPKGDYRVGAGKAPLSEGFGEAICPLTHGKIVFAARNLYNSLTQQNMAFDDACDNTNFASRKAPTVKPPNEKRETRNDVSVFPNPTTGYVYITLPNTTDKKICWQIEVTNTIGAVLQHKKITTKAGKTFIELKGSKGLYFVRVINCSTGTQTIEKIILE